MYQKFYPLTVHMYLPNCFHLSSANIFLSLTFRDLSTFLLFYFIWFDLQREKLMDYKKALLTELNRTKVYIGSLFHLV